MNCLLAGAPTGTAIGVARALLAASPGSPVTVLSDDTEGVLRVLDEPGLGGCEVLWADPATPATVDDALVYRRMLHGRPDVVVVVADGQPVGGDPWRFGGVLVPRLSGTPLVITGAAAAELEPRVVADLAALDAAPPHVFVPGHDPGAVLHRAAELRRAAPPPWHDSSAACSPATAPTDLRPHPDEEDDHDEVRAGRGPRLGPAVAARLLRLCEPHLHQ